MRLSPRNGVPPLFSPCVFTGAPQTSPDSIFFKSSSRRSCSKISVSSTFSAGNGIGPPAVSNNTRGVWGRQWFDS